MLTLANVKQYVRNVMGSPRKVELLRSDKASCRPLDGSKLRFSIRKDNAIKNERRIMTISS